MVSSCPLIPPSFESMCLCSRFHNLECSSVHLHLADYTSPAHPSKPSLGIVSSGKPSGTAFPFFVLDQVPAFCMDATAPWK